MHLEDSYRRLRQAQREKAGLSVGERRKALVRLRTMVKDRAEDFADAIDRDFGGRSRHETLLTEIAVTLGSIDHATPRIRSWAKSERVNVGWRFWPASGRILKEPLGVVGIVAPWNYPVQLALLPLVGALSAGCRVLLKPSEATPATADLIADLITETFDPEVVAAVTGGPDVAAALTRLPLDGLLFTGSTSVGRRVMAAAAENLTPVTLELGGKSPAVVDESADLASAAEAVMAGKLLNAGQTCIAPDYVLVSRRVRDRFVAEARTAARRLYPDPDGPDYSAIKGADARRRLIALYEDLDAIALFDEPPSVKLSPTIVLEPPLSSDLMQQEIFGPVLPVLSYDHIDEAIAVINDLPPPLAIYWFGRERQRLDKIVHRTRSGAVVVNDTVVHAAVEALPFGGVGTSGVGAYHGHAGFEAFTHRRSVFTQSRWGTARLLRPPYGPLTERILSLLLR